MLKAGNGLPLSVQIYTLMLELTLLTAAFLVLAVLLLCIKMLLRPGSKFGATHIGGSAAMRRRGIHCVESMDAIERRTNPRRVNERKTKN